MKKIDLSEDIIGEKIIFLYNLVKLDFKSKRKVESQFRKNSVINVIDLGNIIPYWHIEFFAPFSKTGMEINKKKTIKEMMEAYANKIGFPKEAIGKEVIFLYKGESLDTKENDIVENVFREEKIVNIFDKGNVIGQLINNTGFSTFNMMNPNINNDFTKCNPNSSGINDLIQKNPITSIYDERYPIINITFKEDNGRKVIINMNNNKTIESLCKKYANKNDLPVDLLGEDVFFTYNGLPLDPRSKSTLGSMFGTTGFITVFDSKNILSHWTIRFVEGKNEFIMKVNQEKTIKDMLEACANKISVPKEDIGKKIFFLYNGGDLATKQNDSVKSVLHNKANITVYKII